MEKKKCLMILAHMDDEVVVGWPILLDDNIEKHILYCSFRQERKPATERICGKTKSKFHYLQYENNFYKLDGKTKKIREFSESVVNKATEIIHSEKIDYIYTHNSWGEYFHLDHIFIHTIIQFNNDLKNIAFVSDICFPTAYWIKSDLSIINFACTIPLDINKYNELLGIYDKRLWRTPPNKSTKIEKML